MLRALCLILSFLLIIPVPTIVQATVYYVDFVGGNDNNNGTSTATPWKRVKGMSNVTGGSIAANAAIAQGDTIVFKGGVQWDSSHPWNIIGGSSAYVNYTTDHSWFTGGAWTNPIFDQAQQGVTYNNAGVTGAYVQGSNWININELKFQRCGPLGTLVAPTNTSCMYFGDKHHVTLTNNIFDAQTWVALTFLFNSPGTYTDFIIQGNEFTKTASAMQMGIGVDSTIVTNIRYTYNQFHDSFQMLGCSVALGMTCNPGDGSHGDGLLHLFDNSYTQPSRYFDLVTVCNNYVYGNLTRGIGSDTGQNNTGMYYQEGAVKRGLICNNRFNWNPPANSVAPTIIFEAVIDIRDHANAAAGTVIIAGNSVVAGPTSRAQDNAVMIEGGNTGTYTYKNNIVDIGGTCGWSDTSTPSNLTSDYNLYRCPAGFNTWVMDGGHSVAGTNNNPLVVANPGNVHLTASSPAIGRGQNLSGLGLDAFQQSMLNVDADGNARGATWDIGAYQFSAGGGGDVTPPSAPTNLRLVGFNPPLKEIDIAWDASTDDVAIQNYALESCAGVGCSTFTFLSNTTSLAFSELNKLVNFSYSYRLRARDTSNNLSAYSSTLTVTTPFAYYHPTLNLTRR